MTKLKIEGMTCNHCAQSVANALANVPGVDKVIEVSLPRKEAAVSGAADGAALVKAVTDLGYQAQVVS